jgi:hypothetical protein
MCHCFQQHFGNPPRRGYHNREWAAQMIEVGLMPSDTGEPGGKQTGQGMFHYIIAGGPFDLAAEALLQTGFCLNWQSAAAGAQAGKGYVITGYTRSSELPDKHFSADALSVLW